MPNRIIRESALTSHSLSKLSDGAERLFWRLTVVADDHGRFDAFPSTVKSKCFPTMVDKLSTRKVHAWLVELSVDHCKFYTVDGRQYGYFCKWSEYQRSYGMKSKFPQPPADCGELPEIPALIRESRIENRETRFVDGGSTEFEVFWNAYPRKVDKKRAREQWAKLTDCRPAVDVLLTAIEKQKRSESWQTPKYIPHPSTWLHGRRWEDEVTSTSNKPQPPPFPPATDPIARNSWRQAYGDPRQYGYQ